MVFSSVLSKAGTVVIFVFMGVVIGRRLAHRFNKEKYKDRVAILLFITASVPMVILKFNANVSLPQSAAFLLSLFMAFSYAIGLGMFFCSITDSINPEESEENDQQSSSAKESSQVANPGNMPVSSDVYTSISNFCSIARRLYEEKVKLYGNDSSALLFLTLSGTCTNGDVGTVNCSFDRDSAGIEIDLKRLGYTLGNISDDQDGWYIKDSSTIAYRMKHASGFRKMAENMGSNEASIKDGLRSVVSNGPSGLHNISISVTVNENQFSFDVHAR